VRSLVLVTSEPSECCICLSFPSIWCWNPDSSTIRFNLVQCVGRSVTERRSGGRVVVVRCGPSGLWPGNWVVPLWGWSLRARRPVRGWFSPSSVPGRLYRPLDPVGFTGASSSRHVWRSYFKIRSFQVETEAVCYHLELFLKLYSGVLEIMITNELHCPNNSICTEV